MYFHGKTAISRVANTLEEFADKCVFYKCYISDAARRNILFDYKDMLRNCLLAMCLLDKAQYGSVFIYFALDFTEVYSTTRRGYILAGHKIIDKDATHPKVKEKLFNFELATCFRNGGDVYASELILCIPLHFLDGKESNRLVITNLKAFLILLDKLVQLEQKVE